MIERLARWYLSRRGCVVLSPGWRGLAIGGGMAFSTEMVDPDSAKASEWTVHLGPFSQFIALNHSLIDGYGPRDILGALAKVRDRGWKTS